MRLARFDGGRIGVCLGDEIVDVTDVCGIDPAEWPAVGPLRLIRDFEALRPKIEAALAAAARKPWPMSGWKRRCRGRTRSSPIR
jgi:hypothetical protein